MRTRPYTKSGIRRKKCVRCGNPAAAQWQLCSDGGQYRPLCLECDIALNEMALKFMGIPDIKKKISVYRQKMEEES